jgi:predicted metal-dependent HD superfamily phosphohydrolase
MNEKRWQELMQGMGLKPSISCFNKLVSAYNEKHRHYHTQKHIEAMLKHFDNTKNLAKAPLEIELAIWFHDAIYKPFSSSNELDSANWASDFLLEQNYSQDGINRIHKMIMSTLHNGQAEAADEQLIVDIDLTILGTAESVYDEFERNVRKEYKLVPWLIYKRKRKEILEGFLQQENIYKTSFYQERFEDQARVNLSRAIQAL